MTLYYGEVYTHVLPYIAQKDSSIIMRMRDSKSNDTLSDRLYDPLPYLVHVRV